MAVPLTLISCAKKGKNMEESKAPRVGAPIKYTQEVPKKLIEFFDRDLFIQNIDGKAVPNRLPTIERFCANINIATSTFYEWNKKYPELSSAFKMAKQMQKDQLIQLSLIGAYKEGFAKFVAINVTDMKDRIETSHSVSEDTKKLIIDMGD
jgi:hypothetical protein